METEEPGSAKKPFACTSCSKSFFHRSSLREHIRVKHVKDELKSYTCEKCLENNQPTKQYSTQKVLSNHIRRVHGPACYKCQICLKTYTRLSGLQQHQQVHLQIVGKSHNCHLCSKTFRFKIDLRKHLLYEHGKKIDGANYFNCELCSLEFVNKSSLESHVVAMHVVDKAFDCHVCSKTFIDQETLDKHVELHDPQLKHLCDVCSKGFKRKQPLVNHLRLKHKKFFYCGKCLRSFSQKSEFDQHLDPKPNSKLKLELKCQICGESFDIQCHLDLHTNNHLKKIKSDEANNKEEVS